MPGWEMRTRRRLDALIVGMHPVRVNKAESGTRPSTESKARAGSSTSIRSPTTSRWRSSVARRRPVPPGQSKHKEVRYFDILAGTTNHEAQLARIGRRPPCPAGPRTGPTFALRATAGKGIVAVHRSPGVSVMPGKRPRTRRRSQRRPPPSGALRRRSNRANRVISPQASEEDEDDRAPKEYSPARPSSPRR